MLRKYFWGIFALVLFLATLAALPRVDYIEPNVFFYIQHLPLIYHICVLASILIAFFSKQRLTQVISLCVLSLLLAWTPSVMLVQPWHLDSYPFVAEPVYVARNGHLGDIQYLSENPALGLVFGPFLLITSISPFALLKVYPGLLATIFTVFVYAISYRLKLGRKASVVAVLLFASILWPEVFHFCRFSFSITYYLISLFLLIRLIFQKSDRRIFALLAFSLIPFAISHPATPLYFILNLAGIIFFAWAFRKIKPKEFRLLTYVLTTFAMIWLLWNMIGIHPYVIWEIRRISYSIASSIGESPSQVSGIQRIVGGHTQIYDLIIDVRLYLTLVVYFVSFLIPIVMYRRFEDKKLLLMLTGWAWSNMATTIPLLYAGLPYFQKPAFFTMVSWGPVAAIVFKNTLASKIKSIVPILLVIFIVMSSLLIPLIKYAPLPLEYPTSRELAGTEFLDLYGAQEKTIMFFEDPAYLYSYILHGDIPLHASTRPWGAYIPNIGLNSSVVERTSLWVTSRLGARDAFFLNDPSWTDVITNSTSVLPATTHDKVYDSGWPECILVPRSN